MPQIPSEKPKVPPELAAVGDAVEKAVLDAIEAQEPVTRDRLYKALLERPLELRWSDMSLTVVIDGEDLVEINMVRIPPIARSLTN